MAEIIDKAILDTSDYLKKLKEIEREINKMSGEADKDFKKVGKAVEDAASKTGKAEGGFKSLFGTIKSQAGIALAAIGTIGVGIAGAFKLANDAIEGVRIKGGFEALAATVGTTGDEIIAAMQRASGGTISEIELMKQANLALQLGVAKTPEEFAKLTRSALVLGRTVGRGPTEALYDLINAAGRRSTEVLDNLGISLAKVNERMEAMAQQEFGKSAESLSVAAKNALFMRAAIEQAAEQADRLGANIEDAGSRLEATQAKIQNFQQDVSEGFFNCL